MPPISDIAQFDFNEWETREFKLLPEQLSSADQELAEQLSATGRMNIDWLAGGRMRVQTFSWVGVVRFEAFEIHVHPKLAGDPSNVVFMYDYVNSGSQFNKLSRNRELQQSGEYLLDLICRLLIDEVQQLLRQGLLTDYREERAVITRVQGHIRVREQMLVGFGRVDQLHCEYDEYDSDNPSNQLLLAAVSVVSRVARNDDLRKRARQLRAVLEEACSPLPADAAYFKSRIAYSRRNEAYRPAHSLSYLLLEQLGIRDLYSRSQLTSFTFLLDMNDLFERFVTRLLSDALEGSGVTVEAQAKRRSVVVHEATGKPYKAIIPDFVLSHPGEFQLPGDAKYKLYDNRSLDPADVYQAFIYSYAFHDGLARPTSFIVYPRNNEESDGVPNLLIRQLTGGGTAKLAIWRLPVSSTVEALKAAAGARAALFSDVRAMVAVLAGRGGQ